MSNLHQPAFVHETVLLTETVDAVLPSPEYLQELAHQGRPLVIADCTLGGGGHAEYAIKALNELPQQPRTILIGIDRDENAIRAATARLSTALSKTAGQIEFRAWHTNFGSLKMLLEQFPDVKEVDGIYADFGVSSPQIDTPERGFSLRHSGPLDMRMDERTELTAREIVASWEEAELERIFAEYGEEPRARKLARAIVADRSKGTVPTEDTEQFAEYTARVLAYRGSRVHPATRIFQALRIAVNDELGEIERLLDAVPDLLRSKSCPAKKAAFISFHSLEDRLVKHRMRAWEKGQAKQEEARGRKNFDALPPIFLHAENPSWGRETPRGGIVPSEQEIERNFRAHSARLRVFCFQ